MYHDEFSYYIYRPSYYVHINQSVSLKTCGNLEYLVYGCSHILQRYALKKAILAIWMPRISCTLYNLFFLVSYWLMCFWCPLLLCARYHLVFVVAFLQWSGAIGGRAGYLPLGPEPFCTGGGCPITTLAGCMGSPITVLPWGPVCNSFTTACMSFPCLPHQPDSAQGGLGLHKALFLDCLSVTKLVLWSKGCRFEFHPYQ